MQINKFSMTPVMGQGHQLNHDKQPAPPVTTGAPT